MSSLSVFEIVSEAIGHEATQRLINQCGGMVFYIPTKQSRNEEIKSRYSEMVGSGYSERQALRQLGYQHSLQPRAIRRILKEINNGKSR